MYKQLTNGQQLKQHEDLQNLWQGAQQRKRKKERQLKRKQPLRQQGK